MTDQTKEFEAIYNSVKRDLYVYILRSVRDEDQASDLLQDSFVNFIKIFKDRLVPDSRGARMYLFRIARNLIINRYRSSQNKKEAGNVDTDLLSDLSNPEKDAILDESDHNIITLLEDLLEILTEDERTAVLLKYMQKMRLEDISSVLGVSLATASRLVKRSIQKMLEEAKRRGVNFNEWIF